MAPILSARISPRPEEEQKDKKTTPEEQLLNTILCESSDDDDDSSEEEDSGDGVSAWGCVLLREFALLLACCVLIFCASFLTLKHIPTFLLVLCLLPVQDDGNQGDGSTECMDIDGGAPHAQQKGSKKRECGADAGPPSSVLARQLHRGLAQVRGGCCAVLWTVLKH